MKLARQQSTTDRGDTQQGQHQTVPPTQNMQANLPAVKLLLDARKTANDRDASGKILISTESWLERATAKAKASVREKIDDKSVA